MTLTSLLLNLRSASSLPLILAVALGGGCTVKITDFEDSETTSSGSATGGTDSAATDSPTTDSPTTDVTTTGITTGSSSDSDSEGGTGTTEGPMTTTSNPTTSTDTDMTSGSSDTSTGDPVCDTLLSKTECVATQECLWVAIRPWQEGELCPALEGEGSCIAGQYVGDGCQVFPECDPERVYHRELAPGEFELFKGTACGIEPLGDWQLCDPQGMSAACECFCSL